MKVQVVIPAYKAHDKLGKCLDALQAQTFKDFGWVMIDDSLESKGFTHTVNQGIREALRTAPAYVVILNQDTYLREDALAEMVAFMDAHPKCGMSSVKQLSDKDPDQIIHGGVGQAFPTGMHRVGYVSRGDHNEAEKMPWAQGACFIVRSETIFEIGLLDENMKMLFSDSDYGYAARARGWEVWYNPKAVCVHEQGVSQKAPDPEMEKVFLQDMLYFRAKWVDGDLFRELAQEVF